MITVYEIKKGKENKIKKKRTVLSTELENQSYTHIEFLPTNNKYLVCITDGKKRQLVLWEWEKSKIITV